MKTNAYPETIHSGGRNFPESGHFSVLHLYFNILNINGINVGYFPIRR